MSVSTPILRCHRVPPLVRKTQRRTGGDHIERKISFLMDASIIRAIASSVVLGCVDCDYLRLRPRSWRRSLRCAQADTSSLALCLRQERRRSCRVDGISTSRSVDVDARFGARSEGGRIVSRTLALCRRPEQRL